jgi:hypothetical protein
MKALSFYNYNEPDFIGKLNYVREDNCIVYKTKHTTYVFNAPSDIKMLINYVNSPNTTKLIMDFYGYI